MSPQVKELRLLHLRDNLLKLEASLLELQSALSKLAAKQRVAGFEPPPAENLPQEGIIYTGESFEEVMKAIPPDSTIVSIERGDGGWKVKICQD